MVTMQELLEAGAHFGHKTSRRNPAFIPFIHGERNGIHIINTAYTLMQLERSAEFLTEIVGNGGKVLFAATKAQAREIVEQEATRSGQFFVTFRWLGGLLTNFKTVRSSIQRMTLLQDGEEDSKITLTKKEQLSRAREFDKLNRVLKGVREMRKAPDAVVVVDLNHEVIAVHECRVLNIPVIGIVDTNSDPTSIAYPIPGNDDAVRAIELYMKTLADACIEGARLFEEKAQKVDDTVEETELALDREEDLDEAALLSRRKVYKVKKTIPAGKTVKPEAASANAGDTSPAEDKSEVSEVVAEKDSKKEPKADAKNVPEKKPVKKEAKSESKAMPADKAAKKAPAKKAPAKKDPVKKPASKTTKKAAATKVEEPAKEKLVAPAEEEAKSEEGESK